MPFVDCSRSTKIHCVWAWLHVIHVVPTLVSTSMLSWYGLIALVSECGAISCNTKTLVSFVVLIVSALHNWLSLPKIFTHVSHLQCPSILPRQFSSKLLRCPFPSAFSYSLVIFCSCHPVSVLHVNSPILTDAQCSLTDLNQCPIISTVIPMLC